MTRYKTKNSLLWTYLILQIICAIAFQRMPRAVCATFSGRYWKVHWLRSGTKESWCSVWKEELREYIWNRSKHWMSSRSWQWSLVGLKKIEKKIKSLTRYGEPRLMKAWRIWNVCILLKTQIYKSIHWSQIWGLALQKWPKNMDIINM